jgi:hypothetical protein
MKAGLALSPNVSPPSTSKKLDVSTSQNLIYQPSAPITLIVSLGGYCFVTAWLSDAPAYGLPLHRPAWPAP